MLCHSFCVTINLATPSVGSINVAMLSSRGASFGPRMPLIPNVDISKSCCWQFKKLVKKQITFYIIFYFILQL
jgi:hypothetical protein